MHVVLPSYKKQLPLLSEESNGITLLQHFLFVYYNILSIQLSWKLADFTA